MNADVPSASSERDDVAVLCDMDCSRRRGLSVEGSCTNALLVNGENAKLRPETRSEPGAAMRVQLDALRVRCSDDICSVTPFRCSNSTSGFATAGTFPVAVWLC